MQEKAYFISDKSENGKGTTMISPFINSAMLFPPPLSASLWINLIH
ncbi:MAG: hypothetical protein UV43_C0040G0008 [Parcubacteria group bacterium GW2011_GWF2_42_7]|nr:MAG: hypothetical protein UU01_C0004G0028 [Parcubacteria group bacterium GW2011_GWA2_40_37]KKS11619.1 MAG: hypothetical protein UU66_C0013G0013 [Parcubacteria group bacterium GW2011_GWB1_41_5]KKS71338.1 MAG: hypothetical protein UV43_C0040G0008 [Parcubacteria group bacterium GW2011_GWF2_42_7]